MCSNSFWACSRTGGVGSGKSCRLIMRLIRIKHIDNKVLEVGVDHCSVDGSR